MKEITDVKLYHYSVDSYKGAGRLTNDYKNNYRFAEPYILALQQSRETFLAVFYASLFFYGAFYSAPILCDDVPATRPTNQNSTLSFNVSSFSFGTVLHEKIGRTSPPVRTTRRSSEKRLPSASVTTGANGS